MAEGETGQVGTTTAGQDKKDFKGPGVEGEKTPPSTEKKADPKPPASPGKKKKEDAPAPPTPAQDTGVITGEHVLRNMRAAGRKI